MELIIRDNHGDMHDVRLPAQLHRVAFWDDSDRAALFYEIRHEVACIRGSTPQPAEPERSDL